MQHLIREAGLENEIEVDSAGTAGYHAGERADSRSRATAEKRGVQLPSIARKAVREDFEHFDYILAMDQDNFDDLQELCERTELLEKLSLLRAFDPASAPGVSVPDPYYGGPEGFDEVFNICEAACRGLLVHLKAQHGLR